LPFKLRGEILKKNHELIDPSSYQPAEGTQKLAVKGFYETKITYYTKQFNLFSPLPENSSHFAGKN
jgi:hypothetical protein